MPAGLGRPLRCKTNRDSEVRREVGLEDTLEPIHRHVVRWHVRAADIVLEQIPTGAH